MSYIPGLYHNVGGNFTFQNIQNIPSRFPLPPPPPPPVVPLELSDQEYLNNFEYCINKTRKTQTVNSTKISELHDNLYTLVTSLNDIKIDEMKLASNIDTLSDNDWKLNLDIIKTKKINIEKILSKMSNTYLEMSRKLVAKRTSKRLRLKRLREAKKLENKERIKLSQEKSRKIDENLQKIKDDIQKAKQDEEEKFQADIVLKEVVRKKNDAKKNIAKLDAIIKLRKARENTAKGRGQLVSDTEATFFENSIDRIKKLWEYKLLTYDKEDADLRKQLDKNNEQKDLTSAKECEVSKNLVKWQKALFGCKGYPQFDFKGNVLEFIAISVLHYRKKVAKINKRKSKN